VLLISSFGPWLSVVLATFALEDAALALALLYVTQEQLSLLSAWTAAFVGISVGDLVLYSIGRGVAYAQQERSQKVAAWIRRRAPILSSKQSLNHLVWWCRFVPGTRLPTYLYAGFSGFSVVRFIGITIVSVAIWVSIVLLGGAWVIAPLVDHPLLLAVVAVLLIRQFQSIAPKLIDKWQRRALLYRWRRWLTFEFWPAWFFYLPVYFYYAFLTFKHRGLLTPFYANPSLPNGGFVGESKWSFLQSLNSYDATTLRAAFVPAGSNLQVVKDSLILNGIQYPFILKPDVGQRGFGVRVIRSDAELESYLASADFDLIVQEYCAHPNEAGVFYICDPRSNQAEIFSITDKKFPFVVGDGRKMLGDLILLDRRARVIAQTYFDRLQAQLSEVPAQGEQVFLSECGNHCQGAIFLNGSHLATPELLASVQKAVSKIPTFYFGRIDLRYSSVDELKNGSSYKIVEVNGLGSEATHIWDANTSLIEAYRVLFEQWRRLFEIGAFVRDQRLIQTTPRLRPILFESLRIFFRQSRLAVSS
jgi:membrane protein DedA with SNARE-associated domain